MDAAAECGLGANSGCLSVTPQSPQWLQCEVCALVEPVHCGRRTTSPTLGAPSSTSSEATRLPSRMVRGWHALRLASRLRSASPRMPANASNPSPQAVPGTRTEPWSPSGPVRRRTHTAFANRSAPVAATTSHAPSPRFFLRPRRSRSTAGRSPTLIRFSGFPSHHSVGPESSHASLATRAGVEGPFSIVARSGSR